MMTVEQLVSKMGVLTELSTNFDVVQSKLLAAGGTTPTASAKRALHILENSDLRALLGNLYPKVTLTSTELNAAPSIVDVRNKLLPYEGYIKLAVSAISKYIPKETVNTLENHYRKEDPIYFVAVTTFVVVILVLQKEGELK